MSDLESRDQYYYIRKEWEEEEEKKVSQSSTIFKTFTSQKDLKEQKQSEDLRLTPINQSQYCYIKK